MRKTLMLGFGLTLLLLYAMANVYASHVAYSPLMARIVRLNDVDAAREFLANVRGSSLQSAESAELYEQQSRYLNSHFDNIFAQEVDVSRLNVSKAIESYEDLLLLNPNNPQVLLKLSYLYAENENIAMSEEYRNKALEIDPWVENK